jgi:4'-phosphopantetheinyl transferase
MPRCVVHVLHCGVGAAGENFIPAAAALLPQAARERAAPFRRTADRVRFLAGRLLAAYALFPEGGSTPAAFHERVRIAAHGRPFLPDGPDFNLSHSGEVAICAVGEGCTVGVDVERIRPVEIEPFSGCFSADEWRLLASARDPLEAFFRYWTIKESVLKADGRGLGVPMREVRVFGREAELEGRRWYIFPPRVGPGHVAHLAVDREPAEVRVREISPDGLLLPPADPAIGA